MPTISSKSRKRIGVAAILGASLMWAIEPSAAKLSYETADVLQTLTVRVVVTALTAMLYVCVTHRANFRIARRHLPKLVYIALVGTVFADLMYFWALTRVPVLNAVLIGHMQPVFVVLIGFLVLREDRLGRNDYVGILILLVSGLLVTTKTLGRLSELSLGTAGDLIVLAATVAWATAGIIVRKYLRDVNAGVLTFYRFAFASVALSVILVLFSTPVLANVYQVLVGVFVGVGYILYYEGLKRMKAAQVAALELSTPFFAAVLGYAMLGESVTPMQMLGIACLFLGVYFLSRKEEMPF